MAISQLQQSLKFELPVPVRSAEQPTACMSFNCHLDHFGSTWDLRHETGAVAHIGCGAFGMDRLAVALFSKHGTDLYGVACCGSSRPEIWLTSPLAAGCRSICMRSCRR